jgi:hypothetical protein
MPDYSKSKIYRIVSPNTPLVYIGSTIQLLSKRMGSHIKGNKTTSKLITDYGNARIELIEEFPCENKYQLRKREGEVIKSNECVNKYIAGRSKTEWYLDNRERLLEKGKKYDQERREDKKKYLRQYYTENKEKAKLYRKENREKINAQRKERRKKKRV